MTPQLNNYENRKFTKVSCKIITNWLFFFTYITEFKMQSKFQKSKKNFNGCHKLESQKSTLLSLILIHIYVQIDSFSLFYMFSWFILYFHVDFYFNLRFNFIFLDQAASSNDGVLFDFSPLVWVLYSEIANTCAVVLVRKRARGRIWFFMKKPLIKILA